MQTRTRIFGRLARAAAALATAIVFTHAAEAQTFATLVNFSGANGANPAFMCLVQGTDGNFYGTTVNGGANGDGTIFRITPGGALTTLHSFSGLDGAFPEAGVVQAANGSFYGTTDGGGANGDGTIFKITAGGMFTTLHSFNSTDGAAPTGALVQATKGDLYGTTYEGGASAYPGYGTIFKFAPSGALTTLHSFDNTDGSTPFAGLVQATNGSFYGTTIRGGAYDDGAIFKIMPDGALTVMHSFNGTNGDYPNGGLLQAADENFYGTTTTGGPFPDIYGTIFKITPAGALTTLYNFDETESHLPYDGLVQATDGNFYGTTSGATVTIYGTIFQITPAGALTTMHSFDSTDGASPYGGLVQGTDGNLYGTTYKGGANGEGTVFSLSVGLGPFVKTLPTSGEAGTAVKILGSNLTGAARVTFNGVAAAFTVLRPSEISTSVPAGATTGTVQVTTPGGTLLSNVAFQVRP